MAIPATNPSEGHETRAAAAGSPGGAGASAVRPSVGITAVTTRDELLLELGEVIGGQAAVRPVDSIAVALEHLKDAKRGQVLVIDTRDVADLRAAVDLAHAQAPHAVLLVLAPADAKRRAAAVVRGSGVFAVLAVPIQKGKASAVLEMAMARAVAKKPTGRGQPASRAGVTVEAFRPRPVATQASADRKRKWIVGGGVGLAVVALAAGAFWSLSKEKAQPGAAAAAAPTASVAPTLAPDNAPAKGAAVAPPAAVDTSIVKGKVDDLLEKARLAMRERRYAEPNGDNALLYYRSAAAADATSAEAKDGLQRVAVTLASRFDEAVSGGRLEEAALALASFKVAAPRDSRIKPLELRLTTTQVSKALADGNTDRAAALIRQAQQSPVIPAEQLAKWRAEIARLQAGHRQRHTSRGSGAYGDPFRAAG